MFFLNDNKNICAFYGYKVFAPQKSFKDLNNNDFWSVEEAIIFYNVSGDEHLKYPLMRLYKETLIPLISSSPFSISP